MRVRIRPVRLPTSTDFHARHWSSPRSLPRPPQRTALSKAGSLKLEPQSMRRTRGPNTNGSRRPTSQRNGDASLRH